MKNSKKDTQSNSLPFILILLIMGLTLLFAVFFQTTMLSAKKYSEMAEHYSEKYGVSKHLILAIIKAESNFNKDAISPKGALGLMQIMPETAKYLSSQYSLDLETQEHLFDEKTNVNLGVLYLSYLNEKFKDERLVILAYNAGEGNVLKWQNQFKNTSFTPPFSETKTYLKKVERYKRLYINYENIIFH